MQYLCYLYYQERNEWKEAKKNQIKIWLSGWRDFGTSEHKALSASAKHLQSSHNIDREIGIFKAHFKFCHTRKGYKNLI